MFEFIFRISPTSTVNLRPFGLVRTGSGLVRSTSPRRVAAEVSTPNTYGFSSNAQGRKHRRSPSAPGPPSTHQLHVTSKVAPWISLIWWVTCL